MTRIRLIIEKKKGVFDPEAKVIETTLLNLDHRVKETSLKKVIEFTLEGTDEASAKKEVNQMCKEFLVNPVLEQYYFELLK